MIGLTLARYFSKRFILSIASVFLAVVALVLVLDFVELMRRAGDAQQVETYNLAAIALFRAPSYGEQIMPFAFLFGTMIAFLNLSRRSELIVTRAAGISAWQFLAPALLIAFAVGIVSVAAYNPLAARLKDRADALEAKNFGAVGGRTAVEGGAVWFRQKSIDGESVVRADRAVEGGTLLFGVTVFGFDDKGQLLERVEAESASLEPGLWALSKARVFALAEEPLTFETYTIATNLTEDQVRDSLTAPDTIGFWDLKPLISRTILAGLDPTRYEMQWQILLARPFLLTGMVLIAAAFSLTVFRFGGLPKMILSGMLAGFVLYVFSKIAGDLGQAGLIAAYVAAWTPALIGMVVGSVVLLHREDG